MVANKHLAVTEETKQRVDALKFKLTSKYESDVTHNETVEWLLDHAPDPDEVNGEDEE